MKNEHTSSTAPLLIGMAAGAALGAAGVMATNTSQRQMRRTARKIAPRQQRRIRRQHIMNLQKVIIRPAERNRRPSFDKVAAAFLFFRQLFPYFLKIFAIRRQIIFVRRSHQVNILNGINELRHIFAYCPVKVKLLV